MFFRFNRRLIAAVILLLIAAICLILISATSAQPTLSPQSSNVQPVLVLDAGHGGSDGGTVATDGTLESQINLQITRRLDGLLRFLGQTTKMTRTDEGDLSSPDASTIKEQKVSDLKNRVSMIKQTENATLISIHQNSLPGHTSVHGAQVFYNTVAPAEALAAAVQQTLNASINTGNEKRCKPIDSGIYLMKEVDVPAILIECGFLSNPEETLHLSNADYQKELAAVIAAGLLQYQTKEGST